MPGMGQIVSTDPKATFYLSVGHARPFARKLRYFS